MRTIPPIVAGTATFVGDVRLPGMVHARVVHPSGIGATLASVGTLDKKRFPNTEVVVKGNLVAVVDPAEYVAIQAASELARTTKWNAWSGMSGSGNLFGALRKADWTTTPVSTGRNVGSPSTAFAGAATKLSATYQFPYEKHAPIGPTAAVADVRPDGMIYVHVHSANPQAMRWELSVMMKTTTDKVVVRNYDGSGHYGRSNGGSTGSEDEAVIISSIVGKPVRLQWMRWDDMQWSTQHPPSYSDVQAGLDASGKLDVVPGRPLHAGDAGRPHGRSAARRAADDGRPRLLLLRPTRSARRSSASPTRGCTTSCRTRCRAGTGRS